MRRFLLLPLLALPLACSSIAEPRHKGGIDPGTGIYAREDEDLIVADAIPLVLTRTYLAGDRVSRQFGIGGTHPGEWYLIGDGATFQWAELILSNGGRIRFERISAGTAAADAVFEHRATPVRRFLGARLHHEPRGWAMTFTDGGTALFKHCNPNNSDVCSILDMRDKDGHGIHYARDAGGRLLEMRGDTQKITFRYDAAGRIDRAADSFGRSVEYGYDDRGRLTRVRGFDGVVRQYAYTERDEMARIEEPHMTIENRYDGSGRVVRQRTWYPDSDDVDTFSFDYTVRDGQVMASETTYSNGSYARKSRTAYNPRHYRTSEVLDVDDQQRFTISFERDPVTNVARVFHVQCADGRKKDADPRDFQHFRTEPDGWSIARWACRSD